MIKLIYAIQSADGKFKQSGFECGYVESLWAAAQFDSMVAAKGYLTKLKKKAAFYLAHPEKNIWNFGQYELVEGSQIVSVELDYKVIAS